MNKALSAGLVVPAILIGVAVGVGVARQSAPPSTTIIHVDTTPTLEVTPSLIPTPSVVPTVRQSPGPVVTIDPTTAGNTGGGGETIVVPGTSMTPRPRTS